jgi:hypothetical protein
MNAEVAAADARSGVIEEDDRILVVRASCSYFDLECVSIEHIRGFPPS